MKYTPFGINATKPWSTQLDLFRDVAPQPNQVAEPVPATPAELTKPPLALANYGPWPGVTGRSWLHMFALHRHTDGHVYTIHPAFDDAPWLDAHAEALGYRPVYAECMSARRNEGEHRFAWDFCTKTGWRELLRNRHLTRSYCIGEAVLRAMHRSKRPDQIDFRIARAILTELGSIDPGVGHFSDEDMVVAVCEQMFFNTESREELAWQRIHAWELGLVRYRKGLAEPTDPRNNVYIDRRRVA